MNLFRGPAGRRPLTNLAGSEGAQLVELAVILPLLMVIIVGIFDFSQAFNLKQELGNAAFLGARVGSSEPTADLSQSAPMSVKAIRDVVNTYLKRADISDCGLGSAPTSVPPPPLTWTYTGVCASGGTFTLTIQRGEAFSATVSSVTVYLVSTQVTISYPYQWTFNRVIGLVSPGANYAGPTQITTTAILPNQD